jgi:acyl carrier protein
LTVPDQARPELQSVFVLARTPVEEAIVAIWSQVLKIDQIGIHDNFFALGGHSLLAVQVLSRLQATFQVEVPLQSFLEAPTVSQLAELLQQYQASGKKSDMPSLRPISREAYRVPSLRQREQKVLMNGQK